MERLEDYAAFADDLLRMSASKPNSRMHKAGTIINLLVDELQQGENCDELNCAVLNRTRRLVSVLLELLLEAMDDCSKSSTLLVFDREIGKGKEG